MPQIVSPSSPAGETRDVETGRSALVVRLEAESERLQREVRAETVRNTAIAEQSTVQAKQVRTFEMRTRETLRNLVARMQEDDDRTDR